LVHRVGRDVDEAQERLVQLLDQNNSAGNSNRAEKITPRLRWDFYSALIECRYKDYFVAKRQQSSFSETTALANCVIFQFCGSSPPATFSTWTCSIHSSVTPSRWTKARLANSSRLVVGASIPAACIPLAAVMIEDSAFEMLGR